MIFQHFLSLFWQYNNVRWFLDSHWKKLSIKKCQGHESEPEMGSLYDTIVVLKRALNGLVLLSEILAQISSCGISSSVEKIYQFYHHFLFLSDFIFLVRMNLSNSFFSVLFNLKKPLIIITYSKEWLNVSKLPVFLLIFYII